MSLFLKYAHFPPPGTALVSNYKDSLLFFNYSSPSKHQLKCYFLCNQEKNQSRSKGESWVKSQWLISILFKELLQITSSERGYTNDPWALRDHQRYSVSLLLKKLKSKYKVPLSVAQNSNPKEAGSQSPSRTCWGITSYHYTKLKPTSWPSHPMPRLILVVNQKPWLQNPLVLVYVWRVGQ